MKKCVTVVGARPQFIKAASVSRQFQRQYCINEVLVHTGQHYDANMSDVFFDELDIPKPQYHLGIGSGSHAYQTGRILESVEQVLIQERPDYLLVYGDTNSTLAAALAAAKLHIPIAHVEAGLRSFNRCMPEEINRVVTDHLSALLFAPTELAVDNLIREGVSAETIFNVGDVMYDAAIFYSERASKMSSILEDIAIVPKNYILATIHRAENTDNTDRMQFIFNELKAVADDVPVVLPLHPRTRAKIEGVEGFDHSGVLIIDPVGYIDMVMLEMNSALVVTDSGGVQKEAFFHRVPCVTIREETEWRELVDLGWNRLAPPLKDTDLRRIVRDAIGVKGVSAFPYGNGDASLKIVNKLMKS